MDHSWLMFMVTERQKSRKGAKQSDSPPREIIRSCLGDHQALPCPHSTPSAAGFPVCFSGTLQSLAGSLEQGWLKCLPFLPLFSKVTVHREHLQRQRLYQDLDPLHPHQHPICNLDNIIDTHWNLVSFPCRKARIKVKYSFLTEIK